MGLVIVCHIFVHSLLLANSYTNKLLDMDFKHLKLQGRNYYPDELLECFGTYSFDNSGISQMLKKVMMAGLLHILTSISLNLNMRCKKVVDQPFYLVLCFFWL